MIIIYFFTGLAFGGLGLAAYLQYRQGIELPLSRQLPWLAAFGFVCAISGWTDMFLYNQSIPELVEFLKLTRMIVQPLSGILLLIFGWGILRLTPLPSWTIFIPGILIVPIAYAITFAFTTFITPSPIEIPIDIWSRYLLYLPGSILAGIGFLRQSNIQKESGNADVFSLMLGAGLGFIFEAVVVGLIVPAAPYGPASYYNYDRVTHTAFIGEKEATYQPFGLTAWLDYTKVLQTTGLPIQFWRMISAIAVSFFVVRGLDVFEAIRKKQLAELQIDRDRSQQAAFQAQILARQSAEQWTDALININRRIIEFNDMESILIYIIENIRSLLQADFIGLALLNEDFSHLFLKCFATNEKSQLLDESIKIDNPLIWDAIKNNQPFFSTDNTPLENLQNICPFYTERSSSLAIVPILLDNQSIGVLWIARCENNPNRFSGVDLVWLECMADQIVIAIQHGIMTFRMQSLSIADERARIAREMHDGLAQVLGYINVQVQALEALLKQGKVEEVESELKIMREAVLTAHQDVRENILSLRTTLANEKGLIPATTEFLEEFGIQTGISVNFHYPIGVELDLSSLAEVQLVCILREALTNVRKHAQAKKVEIKLSKTTNGKEPCVTLLIHDDGKGFIENESKRTFGLQTMRERAISVNGQLTIHSSPGNGTTILCQIPCLANEYKINNAILSNNR